jgi:hypothetical protein
MFRPELYPPDWFNIRAQLLEQRAHYRCECTGQCGLHQPNPRIRRCTELHGHPARWARGKVILTIAHICKCDPKCGIPEHLLASCQRCHLRIDRFEHAKKRLERQRAARLYCGPERSTTK